MAIEKLAKLEEQLYNETPLLGDRIRQQALKQLIEINHPESIKLLAKALVFNKDKNVKNTILSTFRKLKLQDKIAIDAICEVWAENRDQELEKLIKSKGWLPSNSIDLRVLLAVAINWTGIIDEQKKQVILPLLKLLDDQQMSVVTNAKELLLSLQDSSLQQEVCRLASEENNTKALDIVNQAGYVPQDATQAALFYLMTEQWAKYQKIDPENKLLEEVYYSTESEELKTRIDEKGKYKNRVEWVWIVLGGQEVRRLATITEEKWTEIITVLTNGKHWEQMWSLAFRTSMAWTTTIIRTLQSKKWLPKNPQDKVNYNNWVELSKKCSTQPPKGKLVRCVHTLEGHTRPIESLIISNDNQLVASAGDDLIRIWNLRTGELIRNLQGHVKSVTSLALNKTGDLLVSAGRDKTVMMWRFPEGNLVQNFSANAASAWCLAMTDNAQIIASGSYQETRLWQFPSGKLFKTLKGHKREVQCLAVTPDNSLLVTGGGPNDNSLKLWQLSTGQLLKSLDDHSDGIWDIAISNDNKILASASKDNTIKLWSLPDGECLGTLEGHTADIWCIGITPDGKILASGSQDNTIKLWNIQKQELITTLEGHTGGVWCLTISQQGDLLATGSEDNTVRLWSLPKGKNMGVLTGHTKPIRCIKITTDNQMLVSGSNDQTLRLWCWDLPRLCSIPIPFLTEDEKNWITETLANNPNITEDEQYALMFLNELINNYQAKQI